MYVCFKDTSWTEILNAVAKFHSTFFNDRTVSSSLVAPLCSVYQNCTASFNKAWTHVLRRLKFRSQRVGDGEDLWQRFLLEIRLHAFLRSTMPEKQFTIIIIIIIIIIVVIIFSFLPFSFSILTKK